MTHWHQDDFPIAFEHVGIVLTDGKQVEAPIIKAILNEEIDISHF
jgi:hypothetical protein